MDFDRIINWHGQRLWHRYAFALFVTFVAFSVRVLFFDSILKEDVPFLFFYISTIVAAWYGGMGPGLVATALGGVGAACQYLKLEELAVSSAAQIKLALFATSGVLFSILFESLHFSRKRLMYKRQMLEMEVAQRHRAQLALVDADRKKNQFVATLAHELRSPLGAISNAVMLLEGAKDDRMRSNAVTIMKRQAAHMKQLIDDLLDTARVSEGKIRVNRQPMLLQEALRNAMDGARPMMEGRGHQLHVDIPQEPIWVNGDIVRLTQVFLNILANAGKYTEPHGHIWVTAKREGDSVRVAIRDNGTGITPSLLPKIFDLYVQAESTLAQPNAGLGIGLNLVRRLVNIHDGTVIARSEGLGKGSEFEVRLPTIATPPEAAKHPVPKVSEPQAARKILVVDDNDASAQTLAWMMEAMGHDVKMANNGPQALNIAPSFRPDIILLDLGLPDMDGYEVCRRLRNIPELGSTRVVAQTGWSLPEQQKLAQEAGFDDHLVKPIDITTLQETLRGGTHWNIG